MQCKFSRERERHEERVEEKKRETWKEMGQKAFWAELSSLSRSVMHYLTLLFSSSFTCMMCHMMDPSSFLEFTCQWNIQCHCEIVHCVHGKNSFIVYRVNPLEKILSTGLPQVLLTTLFFFSLSLSTLSVSFFLTPSSSKLDDYSFLILFKYISLLKS